MSTLLLYEAPFSHGTEVAARWSGETGARPVDSATVIEVAGRSGDISRAKLERALTGSVSVFNTFTHEHERAVAALRVALSQLLADDDLVVTGPAVLLVPRSVSFTLHVCLVAPLEYRIRQAVEAEGCTSREAERLVARFDSQQIAWADGLFGRGPWDPELYDIVLPMHSTPLDDALGVIRDNAAKPVLRRDQAADASLADFQLAARVNARLAEDGHDVEVACENGYATVVINRYAMLLERLEDELKRLAKSVPGVREVSTRVGPRFRQPGIYVELDAATPAKVLLVDDEREYVQTLSERLLTRNVPSAVAYSGEEALAIIESDEPEVVVLDLQMPGIDGIEVLRRVRRGHPDTQVIILTGHGSEREARLAAELGAFAYLRKPVDISVLSKTMKDAYAKISAAAGDGSEPD